MVKSQWIAQRVFRISESRNSVKAVWWATSSGRKGYKGVGRDGVGRSNTQNIFLYSSRKQSQNSSEPYFLGAPQQALPEGISEPEPNK